MLPRRIFANRSDSPGSVRVRGRRANNCVVEIGRNARQQLMYHRRHPYFKRIRQCGRSVAAANATLSFCGNELPLLTAPVQSCLLRQRTCPNEAVDDRYRRGELWSSQVADTANRVTDAFMQTLLRLAESRRILAASFSVDR